jgi:DNA-binding LytR/AlgR family response regulator
VKALIVDDEPLARRRLARLLARIPDVEVAGEAADGAQALEAIRALRPDVVLLDIRMPELDGMRLAREAADLPPIIFVTAHAEHAVEAFEANAIDYLLKPVDPQRLAAALAKVARAGRAHDPARIAALVRDILREPPADIRITARSGNTIRVFDPRRIARLTAADRYTLFRDGGAEFVLDESLAALEARLAPIGFVRAHRSEIVNLAFVDALRFEDDTWEILLTDGQVVPVSRRMAPELKRRLGIK